MRIDPGLLPFVDEHSVEVDSPPERVWAARGRVYRALVIGARTHVLATRGMLARVKARAERS